MKNHIYTPNLNKEYRRLVKGKGIFLYDDKGNKYLDSTSGPFASSVGHGRKEIADAMQTQAFTLEFAYRAYSINKPMERVAEHLHKITGHEKFMVTSGGTEANEAAIRIARKYFLEQKLPQKYKVIGRHLSYHGSSMFTISVAEHIGFREDYQPYVKENGHIPPAYCYRCWYKDKPETCSCQCALALEQEILKQNPDTVAAVLLETVSGTSLAAAYPENTNYYKMIAEICKKYNVLLILDEVLVGAGRTGKFNAFEHFGIYPDIMTMAKGIGGGYLPVAVTSCSKEVAEVLKDGSGILSIGHTMTNQPMQAAVMDKVLDIIEEEHLVENAAIVGEYLGNGLKLLKEKHPTVGRVSGIGLLWGIEFVANKDTKKLINAEYKFASVVTEKAAEFGMLSLAYGQTINSEYKEKPFMKELFENRDIADGMVGDKIMVTPPLTITLSEIDQLLNILDMSITAAEKQFGFISA
jgi:adenosylmethionine-8-amino-7-oxononanoate aminotransferase